MSCDEASGPTILDAYDTIFGLFKAAWEANAYDVVGFTPEIEWPAEPERATPLRDGDKHWARIAVKHDVRRSSSVSQSEGRHRIEAEGTVMVNIFVPVGKRGLTDAARLGKVAVDAFEGKRAGGIWFSEVSPEEAGVDGAWLQMNVKARFHYDNRR